MLAVPGQSVRPVHRLVAFGRQIIGLRQFRPAREVTLFDAVQFAYLLQTDNVCVKLFNRMTQIVNFQAPPRPKALHTLMDVVGGNTHDIHAESAIEAKWLNSRIASELDGEKHFCAATWYGTH